MKISIGGTFYSHFILDYTELHGMPFDLLLLNYCTNRSAMGHVGIKHVSHIERSLFCRLFAMTK